MHWISKAGLVARKYQHLVGLLNRENIIDFDVTSISVKASPGYRVCGYKKMLAVRKLYGNSGLFGVRSCTVRAFCKTGLSYTATVDIVSKVLVSAVFGGHGGIRALDALSTHIPLAGERLTFLRQVRQALDKQSFLTIHI